MKYTSKDLGKKESRIAIITEPGELVEKRMRTERERPWQFFAARISLAAQGGSSALSARCPP